MTSMTDANDHVLSGVWENFGDVTYSATINSTDFNITGTLQNRNSGMFTLNSVGGADWFNGGTFLNEGTFIRNGSGTILCTIIFNNDGTLRGESGTISFDSGGIHGGTLQVVGGTLRFGGGTHSFTAGSFTGGAGAIRFSGGTNTIAANVSVDLMTLGGLLHVSGGTLTVDATGSTEDLTLSGGTLTGSGELTVTDLFTWSGSSSTIGLSGKLITASTSTSILGDQDHTLSGTWENAGGVTYQNNVSY